MTSKCRASFLKILASDGLILNFLGATEGGGQKFHWGRPHCHRHGPPLPVAVGLHAGQPERLINALKHWAS